VSGAITKKLHSGDKESGEARAREGPQKAVLGALGRAPVNRAIGRADVQTQRISRPGNESGRESQGTAIRSWFAWKVGIGGRNLGVRGDSEPVLTDGLDVSAVGVSGHEEE